MPVKIVVETSDPNIAHALFRQVSDATAAQLELPDGTTVECLAQGHQREVGEGAYLIELVLSFVAGSAANVVAAWIYNALKKEKPETRLYINRKHLKIDRDALEITIEEEIEREVK